MAATKKGSPKAKADASAAQPVPAGKAVPKTAKAKAKAAPVPAPTPEPVAAPVPATKKVAKAKPAAPAPAAEAKPAKAAPKKAAVLKLTDKQQDFLRKIGEAGEQGYEAIKAELRSLGSLLEKKLVKKGAKDKATGTHRYHLTKDGGKHVPAVPAATPAPAPSPVAEIPAPPL